MKKLISLAGLEILFLVFISFKLCESGDKSNKISIQGFPMTVGSQWTYVRTDSLFQSIHYHDTRTVEQETITVQIISEHKTGEKGKILEWVRTFTNKVDTEYVVIKENTVMLLTSKDTAKSEVVLHFVFPLEIGRRWTGKLRNFDSVSYNVVRQESVTVPAGKFTNAYLIRRMTEDLKNPGLVSYWVVPEIGIVKMHRWSISFFGSSIKSTTWELVKYDVRK